MARPTVRLYWALYSLLLLTILVVGTLGVWYRFSIVPKMQTSLEPATAPRSSVGAIWMDHAWVDAGKTEKQRVEMAETLARHGFTDAYFHVGPLQGDGGLSSTRYAAAPALLKTLKAKTPTLHAQAWIGQVSTTWGGPLDLANAQTRENIVTTAEQLLDAGFDGIHLNIEPVLDEDPDFLSLLAVLREQTRERGKLLSLASDDVEPFLGAGFLVRSCCRKVTFWKPAYLAKVFGYVDQVAVMTYDSSLGDPLLYSWYVAMMTERLAMLVPEGKTLFIGIPSFETGNKFFDPTVENIRSGLTGVIAGLKDTPVTGTLGVALYAYWETSEEEWQTYATYWLGKRE